MGLSDSFKCCYCWGGGIIMEVGELLVELECIERAVRYLKYNLNIVRLSGSTDLVFAARLAIEHAQYDIMTAQRRGEQE